MGVEIERKFLVEVLPGWLSSCPSHLIEQGYLALEEEAEVRVRLVEDRPPTLTVKHGHGRIRAETEIELSREQAEPLWPLTEGRRVSKRRHLAEREEGTWEVDVYQGELSGLVVAEIEFASEKDSGQLDPPDWVGPEVTGERAYENRALAEHGRTDEGLSAS